MVPCSGLHAHRPARSHSSAQPRPPVHRTRRRPHRVGEGHGGHRHTWTPRHTRAHSRRKAGDCGCAQGPPGCTTGRAPGKGTASAHRRRPESHGTTTLDTRLPSGHQNLQSQAFWTHNPSAMTHTLSDVTPGHTNLGTLTLLDPQTSQEQNPRTHSSDSHPLDRYPSDTQTLDA